MNCVEPTKAQFFALNKKSAWEEGQASGVEIGEDGIRLAQHLEYAITKEIAQQALGVNVRVVDFAIGACNLLYVLAVLVDQRKALICTYDLTQDLFEQLEGMEIEPSVDAHSIAFAVGKLYYIGDDKGVKRVIALDWPANRIEWRYPPPDQDFVPIDLAAQSTGNLFAVVVHDRGNSKLKIVILNATGRVIATCDDTGMGETPPTAIAVSADGLYVLYEESKKVFKLSIDGKLIPADGIDFQTLMRPLQADRLPSEFTPAGLAVDDKGRIYISDGRVTLPEGVEDDRFLHKFDADGNYLTPVAGFRGSAKLIAVDRTGKIVLLKQQPTEQQKIIVLKPKEPKEAKTKSSSVARGGYFSRAFDSTTPGTEWHKLAFEATIPANTQLLVAHYVAEDNLLPDDPSWSEPIEFSPATVNEIDKTLQLTALINGSEAHPASGRYLWLKLTLIGGEQGTPEVKSVRIYFPRLSYLRYLPAVYQQDKSGRDFLERFLSLFETFFADIEQRIDHITRYFDADGVANEFLRWLAGWLAIAADEDWTNEQLRSLMRQAPTLFRRRGTRAGLEELVRIFTGEIPFILEPFQIPSAETEETLKRLYRWSPDHDLLKHGLQVTPGQTCPDESGPDPYYFYVFLKPNQAQRETERTVVRRLIEAEKPAHTRACILNLEPWIYLDEHTYLGVNTILSEPPARLDMGAPLGDTRLTAPIDRQQPGLGACGE